MRDVKAALEQVRDAPLVVDVLRTGDVLSSAVAGDRSSGTVRLLLDSVHDADDELTAVAAVHALGHAVDDGADAALSALLSHERAFVREHAAWVLGRRLPRLEAIGRLVQVVVAGGFSGVLAQRTLETWAPAAADHVALALEGAMAAGPATAARVRLAETLGLTRGQVADRAVLQVALDGDEDPLVRRAAASALGDRRGDRAAEDAVAALRARHEGDADLASAARLAALDLTPQLPRPRDLDAGLTVAQLYLHADLDRGLTRAGAGDNGGVATMLVRLGDALADGERVDRVLTLHRGSPSDALASHDGRTHVHGHHLVPLTTGRPSSERPPTMAEAWPARIEVQRAVRRVLERMGPVDVVHLRMADVGTLAAATVAARHGVPVVFTLAPDPQAVIHRLDMTGELTRANFGTADEIEHFWFRARLVQRLARSVAHRVLFPRPRLADDLRELVGVDVNADQRTSTVVPEGIDLSIARAAESDVRRGAATDAVRSLESVLAPLPPERRDLPLLVTVGRIHRVKGTATVVEAWASDESLRDRCNLLVVGGELDDPSPDERTQLDRIEQVVAENADAARGLVLAGNRPPDVVASWLSIARLGTPALVAPGGAYVCGSLKEEFGLALVEALAAGLVVVAPHGGGPATFVHDGVTGVLVDTGVVTDLAAGMRRALDLAGASDAGPRALQAQQTVEARFTVQAMARTLEDVYAAAGHRTIELDEQLADELG